MKKKIVISGPILSRSGYGEMCRFALRSLRNHEDKFDIFLLGTNWGNTGWIVDQQEEVQYVSQLSAKTQAYLQQTGNNPNFDISLQITIPNEWKKMAVTNIGYTAGIETNFISPSWLEPSQQMDKIIVISEHAKSSFINTVFGDKNNNQFKVTTPIEVCHFPVKDRKIIDLKLNLKHDFNFLAICQWGPRKNLEQTITNFVEEFKNEEVGLVLKINITNDSIMDRDTVEKNISMLMSTLPSDRKCTVTLLHGYMSEDEINSLYNHPQIKAFVSSTHGEGFGFPMFEAAYSEIPVIATDWSGHLDFLTMKDENGKDKKMFGKIDYELKPIAKEHSWKGVLEEGTSWAYPLSSSLKSRMREVYKDYPRFKSWAKKLNVWIRNEFTVEKVCDKFFYSLGFYSKPKTLEIKPITGLSFCIPTNGKRIQKTLLTIKSIQKQKWYSIPYEIIITGDVDNFKNIEGISILDKKQEAHSRKVAALRNAAAEKAQYENIVFCDDDVILSEDWLDSTIKHSLNNSWEVLGNRVLSPDGTRYWDRATLTPHTLVEYDHDAADRSLYQSSAFFMVRKDVFDKVKWDETKLVFSDKEGGIPEDVQYSLDLIKGNYQIHFNKNSLVWHNDDSYTEFPVKNLQQIQKKQTLREKLGLAIFPDEDEEFKNLIKTLQG